MKIRDNKQLYAKGFTLIEVMAAIMIISIGLIGSLTVISYNLRNISSQEKNIVAAGLAAEGIELVRNIRDTNWLLGLAWDNGLGIPNIGDRKRIKIFCGGLGFASEFYDIGKTINNCPTGGAATCAIERYKIGSGDPVCYSDDHGGSYLYEGITYTRADPRSPLKRLVFVERMTDYSIKVDVFLGWNSASGVFRTLTAQETLYNWK